MNLFSFVQKWSLETLFPKHCVGCGENDQSLCSACFSKIIFIKQQQCGRCLKISDKGKTCSKCKKYWALDNLIVAAYYQDGPVKELIHTLKYNGRKDLIFDAARILDSIKPILPEANSNLVIMPVPLHRHRKWWRGFNQSEEIAKHFFNNTNFSINNKVMVRTIHTRVQASLHRKDRMNNLLKAFKCKTCLPPNTSVILVDDIATTGATLNACALALKKAGAKRVFGVVIARSF